MRAVFGSRVRRTVWAIVAAGFLALLPSAATFVPIAADGMACYVLALTVGVGAWLTRPKVWAPPLSHADLGQAPARP
jgi:hypothetical protein